MARKKPYINFTPRQNSLLEIIAKMLNISIEGAVEYALNEFHLLPHARIAYFFAKQIEASPGSRLTREEVWAAYLEWCRLHGLTGKLSTDHFAAIALVICGVRQIAVRVRDNQVVCVDVRLKQAPDGGGKDT
jgi:hypothetical protein